LKHLLLLVFITALVAACDKEANDFETLQTSIQEGASAGSLVEFHERSDECEDAIGQVFDALDVYLSAGEASVYCEVEMVIANEVPANLQPMM